MILIAQSWRGNFFHARLDRISTPLKGIRCQEKVTLFIKEMCVAFQKSQRCIYLIGWFRLGFLFLKIKEFVSNFTFNPF
jgi:hypothetical protein